MYNPNSVAMAMNRHRFDSYWKNTSSFASINTFITMNYAGLKDDILKMISGGKVRVNTNTFQNDFSTIASKDDALTALIHLGYLAYDAERKKAYMPNYEVATAFEAALQTKRYQGALSGYHDKILLVGINYDAEGKDKKHHTCVIEEWKEC